MKYNTKIVKAYFKDCGIPEPMTEFFFHPHRRWRFDFAWPEALKVALEVEGGIYQSSSGHRSISGILRDISKYNEAALMGWLVLRCTPANLCTVETVKMVRQAIKLRSKP